MNLEDEKYANSDIPSVAMASLIRLEKDVKSGLARQNDPISKAHLQDIQKRIDAILNPN